MKFTVINYSLVLVENPTNEFIKYMTIPNKIFISKSRRWLEDNKSLLFPHEGGLHFLTGLLPRVLTQFPVEVEDRRIYSQDILFNTGFNITTPPRDYQISYAIEAIKKNMGIIKAPTGSGKTLIIALLAALYPFKTFVLSSGVDLQKQTVIELTKLLPEKIVSDNWKEHPDILVMLPGRAYKNISELQRQPQRSLLLADEAHTHSAKQARDFIVSMDFPYRFGLTATPTDKNNYSNQILEGLFGNVISLVNSVQLQEQGYAPTLAIKAYRFGWDGNFHNLEHMLIVNNNLRNQKIVDIHNDIRKKNPSSVILILIKIIDHGHILQNMIPNSIYLHGGSTKNERNNVKVNIRPGETIIASNIFVQGIDIPQIEFGINAAGGMSSVRTKQRVGRVNRLYNESVKYWVDIVDYTHPTLIKHSKQRLQDYFDSNFKVQLVDFEVNEKLELDAKLRQGKLVKSTSGEVFHDETSDEYD